MKKFFVTVVLALAATLSLAHAEVKIAWNNSITVRWQGEAGKFYQVSKATSLSPANWIVVDSNIIGETNEMSRSYPVVVTQNAFFKVDEMTNNIALTNILVYNRGLDNINLANVLFTDSDVISCSFSNSNLRASDWSDTIIDFTLFDRADLRNTTFLGCPYIFASFYAANMSDCDFNGSYVYEGDFRNTTFDVSKASFFGAYLYGCNFTGAVGMNTYGGHFSMCTMPDGSFRNDP